MSLLGGATGLWWVERLGVLLASPQCTRHPTACTQVPLPVFPWVRAPGRGRSTQGASNATSVSLGATGVLWSWGGAGNLKVRGALQGLQKQKRTQGRNLEGEDAQDLLTGQPRQGGGVPEGLPAATLRPPRAAGQAPAGSSRPLCAPRVLPGQRLCPPQFPCTQPWVGTQPCALWEAPVLSLTSGSFPTSQVGTAFPRRTCPFVPEPGPCRVARRQL